MATTFSGGRSQSTRREPPTMVKKLGWDLCCARNDFSFLRFPQPHLCQSKITWEIKVRECRRVNQKRDIQIDWRHRVHKTKKIILDHGRWFSPGTLASSTTETGRHDIAEILLKVALKHQKINQSIKMDVKFTKP
jgi:hypothetical protein